MRLIARHPHLGFEHAVIVQAGGDAPAATLKALARSGAAAGIRDISFTFVAHRGGTPDIGMVRRVLDPLEIAIVISYRHVQIRYVQHMSQRCRLVAMHTVGDEAHLAQVQDEPISILPRFGW